MKLSVVILIVSALALCVHAESTCYAKITAKARTDAFSSWYIGATHYQIYDIIATNEGSCTLTKIIGLFSAVGAGGFISEAWNYDKSSGLFSGFGGALSVGQAFYGAGFVLANSSQPILALTQPTCVDSCFATTAAPTTSAPTTSSPSTSAPSSCAVTTSVSRDDAYWIDSEGKNNSVYHLTINNAGPCALKEYILSFIYNPGTLVSYWNLESTTGGYKVIGFGPSIAAGASFTAVGMILADAPKTITVAPYSSSCAC